MSNLTTPPPDRARFARLLLPLLPLVILLIIGCGVLSSPTAEQDEQAAATETPAAGLSPAAAADTATATQPTITTPTGPVPTATTPANIDIPALQPEFAAPTAAPTPATASFIPGQPVRLIIDAIGMDRPLIRVGLDDNRIPIVPMHDVGWYEYSAYPGEGDNIVLWGHVLRFKATPDIPAPFARLHEVSMGDELTLYTARGTRHAYVVTEQVWAMPDQVEYILPKETEQLTLVSCIGDTVIEENTTRMTHRLITIARPAP